MVTIRIDLTPYIFGWAYMASEREQWYSKLGMLGGDNVKGEV